MSVAELRVGIDVSPLELTGAGTARYLRKLLAELEGVDVRRYAFPGSSRPSKVVRDTVWYLGTLRSALLVRVDAYFDRKEALEAVGLAE